MPLARFALRLILLPVVAVACVLGAVLYRPSRVIAEEPALLEFKWWILTPCNDEIDGIDNAGDDHILWHALRFTDRARS